MARTIISLDCNELVNFKSEEDFNQFRTENLNMRYNIKWTGEGVYGQDSDKVYRKLSESDKSDILKIFSDFFA